MVSLLPVLVDAPDVHLLVPKMLRQAASAAVRRGAMPSAVLATMPARRAVLASTARSSRNLATASRSVATGQAGLRLRRGPSPSPSLPLLPVLRRRGYATGPNQEQVAGTFGASFVQFILVISKIARITLYTALALALAVGAAYEGTHQYVERVSMPRITAATSTQRIEDEIRQLLANRVSDEELACFLSWVEEAQDEAWAPPSLVGGGTDPRLGWRGRHAVRSAFIATEWGTGLDPAFFFNSSTFFGRPTRGTSTSNEATAAIRRAAASLDQSLQYAEVYLISALHEAERKGIRLPEPAAQRALLEAAATAGAVQPTSASLLVPEIDPTVLNLEMRLASVRERQGTRRAQAAAITGYERIFDALASSASSLEPASSTGVATPPPTTAATPARLVRIATKVATLNHALGRRDEAEAWYLRAIELASEDRLARIEAENESIKPSASAEFGSSSWAFWRRKEPANVASSAPAPATGALSSAAADAPSNPGLTRALVSALIGLSAWYASAPTPGSSGQPSPSGSTTTPTATSWLASLEAAVRVQSSALRLIRLEQARSALASDTPTTSSSPASQGGRAERLHAAWIELNDGTLCSHLAETLYALQAQPQHRRASALPPPSTSASKKQHGPQPAHHARNRYVLSLSWLHQAQEQASSVLAELAVPLSKEEVRAHEAGRKRRDERVSEEVRAGFAAVESALPLGHRLRHEWLARGQGKGKQQGDGGAGEEAVSIALAVPAFRLFRDASRLQVEVQRMVEVLERQGGGKGK